MKKKSLRETLAENAKAMDAYAKMFDRPTPEAYTALTMHQKPKRAARAPLVKFAVSLEADISKAISQLLSVHPNVRFAVRQNSGSAMMTGKGGVNMPVYFYRWAARKGVEMRITDFWGQKTNGVLFALEVKRPGWTKPTDQREREQANFIEVVGFGGFVTCVEDAKAILD